MIQPNTVLSPVHPRVSQPSAKRVHLGQPAHRVSAPPIVIAPTFSASVHPVQSKYIDDEVYNLIRSTPKIDLHEHQSGSSDLALLKTSLIFKGQREKLDWELIREEYRVARDMNDGQSSISTRHISDDGSVKRTPKQLSLEDYRKTSEKINPLVKNPHSAYLASHLFALEASTENVRYAEYRLYPEGQGASAEEIVQLVEEGFKDASYRLKPSRKKFDFGMIILAPRHGNEEINPVTKRKFKVDKAVELAEKTVEWRKKGINVVGFDLATDEINCPVTDFQDAFDVIHRYNETAAPEKRIGITIHAGETPRSGHLEGWQSVQEAVRLGWRENTPMRIGHGVQLIHASKYLEDAFQAFQDDPNWEKKFPREEILKRVPLLKEIIDKKICMEMCPKSNVQTGAVDSYKTHPAVFFSRLGVPVSISSDNRTISNSDNTNDYVKLYKYANLTHEDRKNMVLAGIESAFIFDPKKKQSIREEILREFERIERTPALALAIYKEKHRSSELSAITRLGIVLWCEFKDIAHAFKQFLKNGTQYVTNQVSGWFRSKPIASAPSQA